jgi:hypothetical protein
MGRCRILVLSAALATMSACSTRADEPVVAPADVTKAGELPRGDEPADLPIAPRHAQCSATDPFAAPVPVAGLEDVDGTARFSDDELTVLMSNRRLDGSVELFQAKRASVTEAFGPARLVGGLDGAPGAKLFPALASGGRTLWFASMHVTESGPRVDIFAATRASSDGAFEGARAEPALNVFRENTTPFVARHATEVWYAAGPSANEYAIFRSALDGSSAGKPTQVVELDTEHAEAAPVLSADGLVVYFSSTRPDGGAKGDHDVWVATRRSTAERFGALRNVGELNTEDLEYPAWVSPDLCRLYIVRGAMSPTSLLVAERHPR